MDARSNVVWMVAVVVANIILVPVAVGMTDEDQILQLVEAELQP